MFTLVLISCLGAWGMTLLVIHAGLVSYPLFHKVGALEFINYHQHYTRRMGWVVIPCALVELIPGALLAILFPAHLHGVFWGLLVMLLLAWVLTVVYSVRYHNTLSKEYDQSAIKHLILTNWFRLVPWSIRALALLFLLIQT